MRESLAEADEFELAAWWVKPSAGILQSGGVERRVPPRIMRLLLVLASRPRQVVAKQELFDRVWGSTDATDESLSVSIYQLRKALGDESSRPRYIETIPKRGYRMLVDARFVRPEESTTAAGETASPRMSLETRLSLARTCTTAQTLCARAVDAEKAFARGRTLLASHSSRDLLQAKLYFEHAISLEPRFAAAHAALASAHVGLFYNQEPGGLWAQAAREHARTAVEIDPSLGWAHAVQALVLGFVDSSFSAADAAYRTALALSPELLVSRRRYALLLAAMQRPDEALEQLAEATRCDPLNVSAQHENAHVLFMLRHYDRAAEELRKYLARERRSWTAYAKLAFIQWLCGDAPAVHATYRAAARACDTQILVTQFDAAFAAGGTQALYARVAHHLEARDPTRQYHATERIAAHIAAGNHGRAIALLQSGCVAKDPNLIWLLRSPYVDPLRSRVDFAQLASRHAVAAATRV